MIGVDDVRKSTRSVDVRQGSSPRRSGRDCNRGNDFLAIGGYKTISGWTAKCGPLRFLAVITGFGFGYARPDGVQVIPIGALGP